MVVLWKLISGRRRDVAAVKLRSDPQHVVLAQPNVCMEKNSGTLQALSQPEEVTKVATEV